MGFTQAREFALFAVLGLGVSWLAVAAIYLEIPRLQRVVPEGLCLASYVQAVSHVAVVAVLPYVLAVRRGFSVPHSAVVGALIGANLLGVAACAAGHYVNKGGLSWALLGAAFVGGVAGSLSRIAVMPFMRGFRPGLISAVSVGQAAAGVMVAIIAAAQQPASDMNFTVSEYFLFVAGVGVLPVAAFSAVMLLGVGRWEGSPQRRLPSPQISPVGELYVAVRAEGAARAPRDGTEFVEKGASGGVSDEGQGDDASDADMLHSRAQPVRLWAALVAWTGMHCWGVMPSFLPFGARGTVRSGDGGEVLQWVLVLGMVAAVAGSFAVSVPVLQLRPAWFPHLTVLFTVISCAGYTTALPAAQEWWQGSWGAPVFVASMVVARFIEHYLLTLVYFVLRTTHRSAAYERHATFVGATERVTVTVGAVASFVAVNLLSDTSCG